MTELDIGLNQSGKEDPKNAIANNLETLNYHHGGARFRANTYHHGGARFLHP